jgi:hypothetical protein
LNRTVSGVKDLKLLPLMKMKSPFKSISSHLLTI